MSFALTKEYLLSIVESPLCQRGLASDSFGVADCDTAAEGDMAAEQLTSVCYTLCSMRGSALGRKGAHLTADHLRRKDRVSVFAGLS